MPAPDERNYRFPLTAVAWHDLHGIQIRLRGHIAHYVAKNGR